MQTEPADGSAGQQGRHEGRTPSHKEPRGLVRVKQPTRRGTVFRGWVGGLAASFAIFFVLRRLPPVRWLAHFASRSRARTRTRPRMPRSAMVRTMPAAPKVTGVDRTTLS